MKPVTGCVFLVMTPIACVSATSLGLSEDPPVGYRGQPTENRPVVDNAGSDALQSQNRADNVNPVSGRSPASPMPNVDRTEPRLYQFSFRPDEADPRAAQFLSTQLAYLDTRHRLRGVLVVYLHGAGTPEICGSRAHDQWLAEQGFHVFSPCYISNYGVGNCGNDIGGCRLEAFEGVDHHGFVHIEPPDSIETRVVKGLQFLQRLNPQGDWTFFVENGKPKWSRIIISGISHGASSSALIGKFRRVLRVVALSGPLDVQQGWRTRPGVTGIGRYFVFTHTGDPQHEDHKTGFQTLGIPGPVAVTDVDSSEPPYGGSHRLKTSAPTRNNNSGHSAVQAGRQSPLDTNGSWLYAPVWKYMYGVE